MGYIKYNNKLQIKPDNTTLKAKRDFGGISDADYNAVSPKQIGDTYFSLDSGNYKYYNGTSAVTTHLTKRIIINSVDDFPITLSSDVEYFINGVIDLGTRTLEIPANGLYLAGFNFDISQLISSENGYAMFSSPVGGSGNVLIKDIGLSVTGTTSKIYDLVASTGDEAIELARVNFNNCTSLGNIDNYRQGLELNTGRFGGTPSLELRNAWGGYRITTSIVRGIDNAMSDPLFKAGAGLVFSGRFLTDINVDLGTLASFADFAPSNFSSSNLFEINNGVFARNGIYALDDATILPNITGADLQATFKGNTGIKNTVRGGSSIISAEVATTIAAADTYYTLSGTWLVQNLEHFDTIVAEGINVMRYKDATTRKFNLFGDIALKGTGGDNIDLQVKIYRAETATYEVSRHIQRVINNLVGARDVAFFTLSDSILLNRDDYVFLEVENKTAARDVTAELDSYFILSE